MAYRILKALIFTTAVAVVSFSFLPPASTASLAELAVSARDFKTNALFGYNEFPSSNFSSLPQWQRILDYFERNSTALDECVKDGTRCLSENDSILGRFIRESDKLSLPDKIRAVNGFFNRMPYKTDRENYILSEYWATPDEFMTRSGDCEDYAIAKYYTLRFLGLPDSQLRIVTVFDSIRMTGHAVLAVYLTEKNIIILDSLSNGIFEHTMYRHYIPQYSVNASARWLHTAPVLPAPLPKPNVNDYTEKQKYFTINPLEGFRYNDKHN